MTADVIIRMLHAVDARDWETLRGTFADELRIDYTSLFGGEPETLAAGELIARWQGLLPGFEATQHLSGPVLVADGRAETHFRAHHWLDGEVWTVYGHYVARLLDGKITELTLLTFREEGNRELVARAAERAIN